MNVPDYEITAAKVRRHGILELTFADGLKAEIDVLDRLSGPVFERARTPQGFREAHIAEGTVAWPGGADLAPDTLYERVRSGAWPSADVVA